MTLNHEWARMQVARAFQPEICPLRLAACGLPLRGGRGCGLLASREDAKTRRKRRGDVEPRMDTNRHECR